MKPLHTAALRLFQPSAFRLSGFFLVLALSAFQPLSPSAFSQAPAPTATVTGRVLNVATGQYLRNAEVRVAGTENYAYTGDDGSYSLTVPAGTHEITASYSGVLPLASHITTTAGATATLNFDLQPVIVDPAAATAAATGPVVLLDRFEVTAEREGQAKAIMDQRAAINAVTIISTDNFGDVTMGSLGEVLKYMPGVSLEYGDTDATGVRIGGLPGKYTTAALDGIAITTNERSVDLTDLTATGIETIEFVQTLTASMDAGSAAGRLNFVSKDPFSRKGTQIRYQAGLNGHSAALNFGGAILPDGRKHRVIFPSGQLNYSSLFFKNRLSIEANLSYNGTYNMVEQHAINYSYLNPNPEINPDINYLNTDPVIIQLWWRPTHQILERYGANLNIGYKITPRLTFSVRSSMFYENRESYALYTILRAYHTSGAAITYSPNNAVDTINSTLTHWVVNGVGDSRTRLLTEYNHRGHTSNTKFATPRLAYKRGSFTADLYGGFSRSIKRYRDTDDGFFFASNTYLSNIGWTADRPSTSSPTWTLTQTYGDPWGAPENWSKRDIYTNGIRTYPTRMDTGQYAGGLDFAYARRILGLPITFKAGGLARHTDYSYWSRDTRYNYLGPTGRPQEAIIPYVENYVFRFPLGGRGGNISDQGWRIDDTYALYKTFQEHPEQFADDTLDNLRRKLIGSRSLIEDINAAYFELNTRVNRLRFNLGARLENTVVETDMLLRRTDKDVAAAGYPVDSSGVPSTEDSVLYQYYNGERVKHRNSYSNFFFSGGFKYEITRNLQAQLSASQTILRPDYDNLCGTMNYDTTLGFVRVPNSTLKPEYMTKFFAGLYQRLEPAGTLSLYAYRMDIKDKQIRDFVITREEAEDIVGYPLVDVTLGDGEGASGDNALDTVFRTTINSPSSLSVYGVTLEYNQQLTFLPGYLKGLSIFSSITFSSIKGAQIDEDKIGQINKSANGGIRYSVGRASIQLRGTWNDTSLSAVTRPRDSDYYYRDGHQYEKSRLIIDLSGGFKLTPRCELSFSIRNLTNSPAIWYSEVPDHLSRYFLRGSYWNVSLKGSF